MEIYYEHSWATVCSDGWDDDDASVICKQLGLSSTGQTAKFGHGSGRILLSNVTCVNNESSIFDCSHNGFGNHNCNHDKDAGVRCHNITHRSNGKVYLSTELFLAELIMYFMHNTFHNENTVHMEFSTNILSNFQLSYSLMQRLNYICLYW